jgi:AAA domain
MRSASEISRDAKRNATGYQMINGISIKNFRCFKSLEIKDCHRINVIVGDNGSGKTALLEAIFMALGTNPEVAARLRQWRGLDYAFNAPPRQVEEAIWGDLFYDLNTKSTIEIKLSGEGEEARSLKISHGAARTFVPTRQQTRGFRPGHAPPMITQSEIGLRFEWRDSRGLAHTYIPKITPRGIEIPGSDEDLPDFFFFAASAPISSIETAGRFSVLSQSNQQREFVDLFKQQYSQIENLSIEVVGGAPAIYATLKGLRKNVPLTAVSGAVNRMLSILLAIVSRPRSVVLVDEADNGIYFRRHRAFWRTILTFARTFDAQLFLTTHNEEWLRALADEAGDDTNDLSLWRTERAEGVPVIRQFPGTAFRAAEEYGGEIR